MELQQLPESHQRYLLLYGLYSCLEMGQGLEERIECFRKTLVLNEMLHSLAPRAKGFYSIHINGHTLFYHPKDNRSLYKKHRENNQGLLPESEKVALEVPTTCTQVFLRRAMDSLPIKHHLRKDLLMVFESIV